MSTKTALRTPPSPGAKPEATSSPLAKSAWERRLEVALPVAAAALLPVLLVRGWGKWNDVLVDFGRELYVPWRLAAGEVLYRDLAYFNGPLSPYANALWFRLFGVGLSTLVWVNTVLVALVALLLYVVLRRLGGSLGAGAALLVFLPVFACGHFTGTGNYNFLCPYSHEMTHGFALSLLALWLALGRDRPPGLSRLAAAGFLLGLVFLTKPEIFLAAASGVGTCLTLALWADRAGARAWLARIGLVAAACLVPPLLAWLLLATAMPFADALYGTLGAWTGIFHTEVAELPFYRRLMGLDRPVENLGLLLASFGSTLLVLAPAALLDLLLRREGPIRAAAWALVFVATLAGLLSLDLDPVDWLDAGRQLPLTSGLAVAAALVCFVRARSRERRLLWAQRAGFAVFALVMLGKVILFVMVVHYGFVLALAASLLFVLVGLEWIPAGLRHFGRSGQFLRAGVLALLGFTAWSLWEVSEASFAAKTVTVGAGADAFQADALRGRAVNVTLDEIERRFGADAALLVLPEGIMVNYLARRRTPTRYLSFMPPEILLFGEETILRELRERPPDAVILVHKNTGEYGYPLFGRHYGQEILGWARRRFEHSAVIYGKPPLKHPLVFGVEILY